MLYPAVTFSNCETIDRHESILKRLFSIGESNKNQDCKDSIQQSQALLMLSKSYFSKELDDGLFRENWTVIDGETDLGVEHPITKESYDISEPKESETGNDLPTASGYKSRKASE